jgi:hypothetical protein
MLLLPKEVVELRQRDTPTRMQMLLHGNPTQGFAPFQASLALVQ